MVKIAILGFGVVGSGTAEVLTENKKIIEERLGCEYSIKYILDLRDFPDSPFAELVTHDFNDILNDDEVTVVAEMMGGSHPAYDFSKACLEAGKHVITSNKEVVSNFGVELCSIAAAHGVRYLFEASVGGGIPVIRPMINDLASNKITKICGILNGTTNYILTKMRDEGASFADALAEAQKLGYAEANPSADVDGIDAARKIVILAALASGKLISPKSIYTEGITAISLLDTKIAEAIGCSIKLIGQARITADGLCALVSPCMVPKSNPLSRIDDVFNGILIDANMVGEVMFYGPGAGKLPTASAVVADIIDVIAHRDAEQKVIAWEEAKDCDLADFSEFSCKRVFITSAKLELPCVKQFVTLDGAFAYLTDEMTETEVEKIKTSNADAILSVFRVI
ncbi:MAG: homoserine dehydrogenase [Clostridia bacterium]|nr:homoserine dehydrogenase [Clostridia bacterium]